MTEEWVASVALASSDERAFIGYRTVGQESSPYERSAEGEWRDAVTGDPADDHLAQTLDFLCDEASRRDVDALAGVYGAGGPEVSGQEAILPRSERTDPPAE